MKKQFTYYLYKITLHCGRLKNHYYLGAHKTTEENIVFDGYYGSGVIIKEYFKKHPFEQYVTATKEIIEINPDGKTNYKREKILIGDKWKTDPLCLNLKPGGLGGGEMSEESLKQLSKSVSKRWLDEDYRNRIIQSKKGQLPWNTGKTGVFSEETIRKMSEAKIGNTPWNKGKTGYTMPPASEEKKHKISQSLMGHPVSEESKQKNRDKKKDEMIRVVKINDDGTVAHFCCINVAVAITNTPQTSVRRWCSQKKNGFMFEKDYLETFC